MRVFLAGRVAIEAVEVHIDEGRFPGRQGRLVFAYLVLEQGRPVPHEELAAAIWGDAPPATWKKALTVLVSKIRALLAECGINDEKALTSAFGCYRLDLPHGAWVDVIAAGEAAHEAEDALVVGDHGRARQAASHAESLARPPFLPGDDGAWVDAKRRELTDVLVCALACLADASSRAGEPAAAVKWAEEAIALEPFRESGYRRLMEVHIAAGNRAEALRVYERCRRLLADELGAFPSPETEAIYRDLLRAPAPAPPAVDEPPAANDASLPLPRRAGWPRRELQELQRAILTQDAFLGAPSPPRRGTGRAAQRLTRPRTLAAAGALLVAGAVAFALVELTTGGTEPPTVVPNSVAVVDAKASRVSGDILVGSNPIAVAAGAGGIWVANADDGTVTHIDPKTRKVVKTIGIGGDVSDIAVGFGSVWVANGNEGTLVRIDPKLDAIERLISLGGTELEPQPVFQVAVGGGAVWATSGNRVIRIDPETAEPTASFPIPSPVSLAVGEGAVWVATQDERLLRLDPRTGKPIGSLPLPAEPLVTVVGSGSVWVSFWLGHGEIWSVDPATVIQNNTWTSESPPIDLAAGRGSVWAAEYGGTIRRIDIRTGKATTTRIGLVPQALAVDSRGVWVAVPRPS